MIAKITLTPGVARVLLTLTPGVLLPFSEQKYFLRVSSFISSHEVKQAETPFRASASVSIYFPVLNNKIQSVNIGLYKLPM